MKKLLIVLGLIFTFIQLHSQKVILFFLMLFAFGCFKVQEKNCQDAREGMVVILKKPYDVDFNKNKVYAEFYPLVYNDSIQFKFCFFVNNKLPKEYIAGDTIRVLVSYKKGIDNYTNQGIHVTCIEKVNK